MSWAGAEGRRRRRSHSDSGDHGSSERWLVSYADLITLLFAFFVVMFAISQADLKKFREVSESMRRAFSGDSSGPAFPGESGFSPGSRPAPTDSSIPVPGNFGGTISGTETSTDTQALDIDPELQEIRRLIEEAIEFEESTARAVEIEPGTSGGARRPARLRWVIQDSYPIRGVEIAEDFRPLLSRVARILAKYPGRQFTLEGHADSQEQATSDPHSWRLAFNRADEMARLLSTQGAGTRHLVLSSRGDESTASREKSNWARARNRRVVLITE